MLERMFRRLGALSQDPRAASLGKDWMVVAIVLTLAGSLLWLALLSKLPLAFSAPVRGVPFLFAVLALSAVLVAGREFWRR
jgi:uncharacterized membrane protein YgdD (TMEM256/DUF423 family)